MPIQIIINAANPEDAILQMADFIGARSALTDDKFHVPEPAQSTPGNGEAGAVAAEAPPEKKTRAPRKPKPEPEPEPKQQEAANDFFDSGEDEADENGELSADDVRNAITELYVNRYGVDAAQADVLKLYGIIFKDGSVQKVSDIPPAAYQTVIDGVKEMAQKNPFKRAVEKNARA